LVPWNFSGDFLNKTRWANKIKKIKISNLIEWKILNCERGIDSVRKEERRRRE
jgi:hypothetical protein